MRGARSAAMREERSEVQPARREARRPGHRLLPPPPRSRRSFQCPRCLQASFARLRTCDLSRHSQPTNLPLRPTRAESPCSRPPRSVSSRSAHVTRRCSRLAIRSRGGGVPHWGAARARSSSSTRRLCRSTDHLRHRSGTAPARAEPDRVSSMGGAARDSKHASRSEVRRRTEGSHRATLRRRDVRRAARGRCCSPGRPSDLRRARRDRTKRPTSRQVRAKTAIAPRSDRARTSPIGTGTPSSPFRGPSHSGRACSTGGSGGS